MKKITNVCPSENRKWQKLILIMKLTLMIMIVCMVQVSASVYSQSTKFSFDFHNKQIRDVLKEIEEQSDYRFFYQEEQVDVDREVNIRFSDRSLEEILHDLFEREGVSFRVFNDNMILLTSDLSNVPGITKQTKAVTGKVTDSFGAPLPGVSIIIKGTTTGIVTDVDGIYSLANVPDDATLVFSFVGMRTQEIVVAGKNSINVTLVEETVGIDEVVAIGYGIQKKVNLTGSVSAIKGEELATRTFSDTRQALQGVAPGMSIIDRGGVPGEEELEMKIRGVSSISAGCGPLVIVDGIEMGITDINPNDIENISVLKDAASCAIYGARAANGVILITTKRGKEGKLKVSYNGYYGLQTPAELPESVTAEQYLRLVNEAYVNAGLNAKYSDDYIQSTVAGDDPYNYPFVNLFEELFKTASVQNHSVSLTGGNELTRMFLSLDYLGQDGMLENVNSKRYGMRLNSDFSVNKNLVISTDINFKRRDSEKPHLVGDALRNMLDCSPIHVLKYPNGIYGLDKGTQSALAELEVSGMDKIKTEALNLKIGGEYDFKNGLKASADFLYKTINTQEKDFSSEYTFYDPNDESTVLLEWTPSELTDIRKNERETNFKAIIEYSRSFKEHYFHAMAGTEVIENKFYYLNGYTEDLYSNEYTELNLGDPEKETNAGYMEDWALVSYMGRLNYNFKERYLLEMNVRYDGSSRFAKGNKWGWFPSVSAGWRISEENFMQSVDFLNNMKIRASWGQLGNQDIGLYEFTSLISSEYPYNFNDAKVSGYAQSSYANTDISWEITEVLDFGIDLSLFKNRLGIVADWYQKDTKDVLLTLPISYLTGLEASVTNAGKIRNKGWELTITHKNKIKDLDYSAVFSIYDVKNKLVDFAGKEPVIDGWRIYKEGESLNSIYGYKSDGLFQSQEEIDSHATQPNQSDLDPGDIRLVDLNGDEEVESENDRTVIGSSIPRYSCSLNLSAQYKGLDFNAFFQGVLKAKNYLYGAINEGPILEHFTTTRFLDRWSENNRDASVPRLEASSNKNNYLYNDFWVRNTRYIRLKSLQLGYTIPKSLVKSVNIEKLRFYVGVTNLFTITDVDKGVDPETYEGRENTSTFYYPPASTWSFGVQLNF